MSVFRQYLFKGSVLFLRKRSWFFDQSTSITILVILGLPSSSAILLVGIAKVSTSSPGNSPLIKVEL